MKDKLQSQLNTFKSDNTEESKNDLLNTLDSISRSTNSNVSILNSVESAKDALISKTTNKEDTVDSVRNVISNLTNL